MNRLRYRLILIFLAATLVPLAATMWLTTYLLEPTAFLRAADEVGKLSKALRLTGHALYQQACIDLKRRAQTGELQQEKYLPAGKASWTESIKSFAAS